jgi:hypothetical protein
MRLISLYFPWNQCLARRGQIELRWQREGGEQVNRSDLIRLESPVDIHHYITDMVDIKQKR